MSDPKWDIVMPIELTGIQWLLIYGKLADLHNDPMLEEIMQMIETCLHTEGLLTAKEIETIKQKELQNGPRDGLRFG